MTSTSLKQFLAFATFAVVLVLAGCDPGVRSCRKGTIFVTLELTGPVDGATLIVQPYLDGAAGASKSATATQLAAGEVSLAWEFPSGYPQGSTMRFDLELRRNAVVVATLSRSVVLTAGCTRLAISLDDATTDGGLRDGGTADQPPPSDFANLPDGVLGPGASCTTNTECATSLCVDGVCCTTACTGRCEACDVAGSVGTCAAVTGAPHGGRGACTGAAGCGDTCDGIQRDDCSPHEGATCGASQCAGGMLTPAGQCVSKTCVAGTSVACELGCLDTSDCVGVVETAHGYYHSCAVLSDGTIRCWGSNMTGEQGESPVSIGSTADVPTQLFGPSSARRVGALYGSTCVTTATGFVDCWGSNTSGQLGRGGVTDTMAHNDNVDVVGITDADWVVGGSGGMFCAHHQSDGGLSCWGGGFHGDGNGSSSATTPIDVCPADSSTTPCPTRMQNVRGVAIGDDHACAIQADFTVACWGGNGRKQLGVDISNSSLFPVTIPGLEATHLSAGNRSTCAVERNTGLVKCWGAAERLGRNVATDSLIPDPVCTSSDCTTLLMGATATAQFDETVCSVGTMGVRCWGSNTEGQLGDGSSSTGQNFAATIAILPTTALQPVQIAAGGGTFCAVVVEKHQRLLRCWGGGGSGQLGNDTSSGSNVPVTPVWNP